VIRIALQDLEHSKHPIDKKYVQDSPGWQESYAGVPSVKNPDFDFFITNLGNFASFAQYQVRDVIRFWHERVGSSFSHCTS
jgi:hypothetical protein